MDPATVVTTSALLAFLVERLTNGIVIALGYSAWWHRHMEPSPLAAAAEHARTERNRRVATFALAAVIAIGGACLLGVNVLASLGIAGLEGVGGLVLTGLLLAAGAEPIHELLQGRRHGGQPEPPPAPVHVTGTLVLEQPVPGALADARANRSPLDRPTG